MAEFVGLGRVKSTKTFEIKCLLLTSAVQTAMNLRVRKLTELMHHLAESSHIGQGPSQIQGNLGTYEKYIGRTFFFFLFLYFFNRVLSDHVDAPV